MRKHQFGIGAKIFISENLTPKNGQFTLNCTQLKRRNLRLGTFTKSATFYIKQNENSRSLIVINMPLLHDMFPNFYDLSKEDNEYRDISGDQNASVVSSY